MVGSDNPAPESNSPMVSRLTRQWSPPEWPRPQRRPRRPSRIDPGRVSMTPDRLGRSPRRSGPTSTDMTLDLPQITSTEGTGISTHRHGHRDVTSELTCATHDRCAEGAMRIVTGKWSTTPPRQACVTCAIRMWFPNGSRSPKSMP